MPVTWAGWRIEPPVSEPSASGASNGGDGRGRAAARAAGDAVEVPRVVGRTVRGVLGRRAHRELVHVRLAERHETGGARARDDRRVERRHVALEDLRSARRGHVGRDEHVLDRERHAGDGAELLAGGAAAVDVGRDIERVVADVQEGVDVAVHGRDAVEVGLRRLDARDLARGELVGEVGGGQPDEVASSFERSDARGRSLLLPQDRGHAESAVRGIRSVLQHLLEGEHLAAPRRGGRRSRAGSGGSSPAHRESPPATPSRCCRR